MKKIIMFSLALISICGCYEEYVYDYEYTGAYIANQYDLRSFVVGEDDYMKIKFGAVVGGMIENTKPRNVYYLMDDYLVNGDLSGFGTSSPFTAFTGMMGEAPLGKLSQPYVTENVKAAGIDHLEPLPSEYYTLSTNKICVDYGAHSGTVTLSLNKDAFLADKNVGVLPYYAVGYRLTDADVDTILVDKSFSIIALKVENTLFGYWYHGGKSETVNDATSMKVTEDTYYTKIPCEETSGKVYYLTSSTPYTVSTDYFHNSTGNMILKVDGNEIRVSDEDGRIVDLGSTWNNPRLLQDRKIFLNYKYSNGDGTTTFVTDTLTFRNRIRDGISEWYSENE